VTGRKKIFSYVAEFGAETAGKKVVDQTGVEPVTS
jgi:hypothetical protein